MKTHNNQFPRRICILTRDYRNDISQCPLSNLISYNVRFNGTDLSKEGRINGLEEAYVEMKKLYNYLGEGNGIISFDSFRQHHTPLCLNTALLPHAPENVMNNDLSINAGGSQLDISIQLDGALSNNGDYPYSLYIFVIHKRVLHVQQQQVNLGK